ncbi:PDZ domain-containing protein [Ekhidna sp. To15]|uniref:PDZ domain-containing protein n=1 Tax=Ekhidna sp. To15 TaxID=3395267 RepID=UPI003F51AF0A
MKLRKWISLIKWKMKTGYRRSQEQATLGVMPDYGFSNKGMRISTVSAGKTAEKYGFREGDIVVKIGDHPILDLISYMSAMQNFNVGDQVNMIVVRDGSQLVATIKFV